VKWTDGDRCQAASALDEDGQCFSQLKPLDKDSETCGSWCIVSQGWFHGPPIDLMHGGICEAENPCSRSVSISKNDGWDVGQSWSASHGRDHSEGGSNSWSHSASVGITETIRAGLFKFIEHETSINAGYSDTYSHGNTWSDSVSKSNSISNSSSVSGGITIGLSTTAARGGAEQLSYCGGWYAVPKIYL